MPRAVVLFAMVAPLVAQAPDALTPLPPESLLLARIKLQMSDNLLRQPNYTCLETIERTRRPKGSRAQVEDTLRLEVALVNGKEMFAWPGSKAFEDKELRDLVATGTFGNGNFAIHARAVFLTRSPVFVSRGEEILSGQPAVRYDFRVSLINSGYTLRVNQKEAIVGYHGSFWADPQTLDLRRLEVFADDIPPELEVDATMDRVDYHRLAIGGDLFLLPVESVLEMRVRGDASRNYTRFTACRQFSGESVLKFTEELRADAPPVPPLQEIVLPDRTELQLSLSQVLELRTLAVGDPITAELRADVKHQKQVIVPKGAVAQGRITRMERRPDHIVVGIAFTDLEWAGRHAAIKGWLASVTGILYAGSDPRRWPVYEPPKLGEGLVRLPPAHKQLSRGMLFYWRVDP